MQAAKTILTLLVVWVLWGKISQPRIFSPFDPVEGFDTKQECEKSALDKIKVDPGVQSDGGTIEMYGPFAYARKDKAGEIMYEIDWRCLPDTIDPRPVDERLRLWDHANFLVGFPSGPMIAGSVIPFQAFYSLFKSAHRRTVV